MGIRKINRDNPDVLVTVAQLPGNHDIDDEDEDAPVSMADEPTVSYFEECGFTDDHSVRLIGHAIAGPGGLPTPSQMPVADLLAAARASSNPGSNVERTYRDRIRSPLTAIRAHCVLCVGGSPKGATNCGVVFCALWPFRTGKNPYYGKATK
jgi:hypothetical protein